MNDVYAAAVSSALVFVNVTTFARAGGAGRPAVDASALLFEASAPMPGAGAIIMAGDSSWKALRDPQCVRVSPLRTTPKKKKSPSHAVADVASHASPSFAMLRCSDYCLVCLASTLA
jgi:hypothetical protein